MRKFLILSIICFISIVFAFSNIGFNLSEIEKIQFMNGDIDRVQIGNSVIYESSNAPIIVYSPVTDFNFTTNTSLNLITITGYKGTGGQVNIPPEINSYPVKNIANSAFSSKSTITGVIVPDSVTNMGDSCFLSCSSMTNIILSSKLKTLGGSTFSYCSKLERVDFPDELTTINEGFTSCSELKEITFGSKINNMFNSKPYWSYCTLLSNIVVSSSNPYYASYDGVLFNSNKTEIIICVPGKTGIFNMPSTVTNILPYSFYYSGLSEINFSENLIGINNRAFVYSKLKQVILPNSLTYIYPGSYSVNGAFENCSSITNVVIGSGLKDIPYNTFRNASSLKYLTLNENVTNIGYAAFYNCSLTNLTLPSSLVTIDYSAFSKNKFTEISIPNGVKSIGDYAFHDCANLTNIVLGSSLMSINSESVFTGCNKLLNIEVSTENTSYASYDGYIANKDLTSAIYYPLGKDSNIIFPEGMKIILKSFANSHYKIRGVDFPSTLTNIEDNAFNNAVGITNIVFREGLVGIGKFSFYGNKAYNIRLPDSLTYLGDYAFSSASSLTNLTVGNSLKVVPYSAFSYCSALKTVTLGNSLEVLGTNCFYYCQTLKDVSIPDSIKDIYYRAFYYCFTLTNVNIGAGLTNIGIEAFNTTGITNFIVSAENQSYTCIDSVIYDKAVKNLCVCASKRGGDIIIPDGVTNVLESAMSFCYNVKNVVFPDSLARLGLYAFWGNSALGYYFKGNAPSYVSSSVFSVGTIYRLESASGWPVVPNTFLNRPTAIWTTYPNPMP